MAKKYIRIDGEKVELRTVHRTFTDEEFEDRKKDFKNRIKAIDDEIKALAFAKHPPKETPNQNAAIELYNMEILRDQESLLMTKTGLETESELMELV